MMGNMRKRRLRQQCGNCFLCGEILHGSQVNKDHLIPTSKTGSRTWKNIVLTHAKCNHEKGNRMPTTNEILRFHEMTGHMPKMQGDRLLSGAYDTPQTNSR